MAVTDLLSSKADDGHEELWVLSYGGGVARIRDDGVRIWRADTGELPSEAIYSAVETHSASGERLIWMASRGGLLRFRGDHVDVFDRRNGLPSDAVRGLKVQHGSDGTDSLWLAIEGGMARATLSDNPWHAVSLLGSSENGTFGVLVERDGHGGQPCGWDQEQVAWPCSMMGNGGTSRRQPASCRRARCEGCGSCQAPMDGNTACCRWLERRCSKSPMR
jgi:hypothetical protein